MGVVVRSTWFSMYDLRLTQPNKKNTRIFALASRTVWKPQPHWLVADWMGLMEPTRGKSCPPGQCRGPAAPEEDEVSSPDEKSFRANTNPATRGRKQRFPGPKPLHTMCKLQPPLADCPLWLIADCLGLMEPTRMESCPSGQRRGPAARGQDKVSFPDQKSIHTATTSVNRGRKRRSARVDTSLHGVETPPPLAGC